MTAAQIRRTGRVINGCVWTVAVAVMVFSLGTAYQLLRAHDVPAQIAWILAPAVDAALVAALIGDRALHQVGVRVLWGTVLRITTGLMTLGLNVGQAVADGDWGGVAIHSAAPVLLIVLTETAQAYQLAFAKAADLASRDDGTVPVPSSVGSHSQGGTVPQSCVTSPTEGSSPTELPAQDESSSLFWIGGSSHQGGPQAGTKTRSVPRPRSSPRPASSPRLVDVAELADAGRKAFVAIQDQGRKVTRDELVRQLRANGVPISTGRATELLRQLRKELEPA